VVVVETTRVDTVMERSRNGRSNMRKEIKPASRFIDHVAVCRIEEFCLVQDR